MKKLFNYRQFIKEEIDNTISNQENDQQNTQISTEQSQIKNNHSNEMIVNTGDTSDYKSFIDPKLMKFSNIIDYTYLKPGTTKDDINKLIQEAIDNKFYSVVVPYDFVDHAVYTIDESKLKVISVIDYPNGDSKQSDKLFECIELISNGADEIDMVMDWKSLKKAYEIEDSEEQQSSYYNIEKEIKNISNECHKNGVVLKVIIESGELTLEQVVKACELVSNGGADFVVNSTGTKTKGYELDKIKEMRRVLPDHINIKVQGGIRNITDCENVYQYVDRIGTSTIPK